MRVLHPKPGRILVEKRMGLSFLQTAEISSVAFDLSSCLDGLSLVTEGTVGSEFK